MEISREHERLLELIGLVRDGGLDDSQTAELEAILESDPEALAYYVESIDVTSMLYRQQGIVIDDQVADDSLAITPASVVSGRRSLWPTAYWAVAIGASLLIGVLAGRILLPAGDSSMQAQVAAPAETDREIATLSFATGCRWESDDQSRYEGQRLTPETLRLVDGVAVVEFDCDVRLVLEGPAQLELASVDHAMLRHGKVVFSGEGDLERFTLETPFSKILDEGTEYAVSVDRSGEVSEVHVFDGRVICEPSKQNSSGSTNQLIQIDAGNARRFLGRSSIEPIELSTSRFVREPVLQKELADSTVTVESFAYDTKSLAGQNGGNGWQQPWTHASRYGKNPGAALRTGESLVWPGRNEKPIGGSLMIHGDAGLQRLLEEPIRMDRDVAYYLSFLARRHSVPQGTGSNGWTYLTLRNSQSKVGHVSIGPITQPGAPRIVHDGRVANATSALREDVVYLFVCKILAGQDQDDQVQVRIYGDHEAVDSVEPSIWNITTRPIRSDSVLNELRLSAKNSPPLQLDELRMGKTWSSVTSEYLE